MIMDRRMAIKGNRAAYVHRTTVRNYAHMTRGQVVSINMYYPVQLGEASNKIYLCQCDQMDPRFGVFR